MTLTCGTDGSVVLSNLEAGWFRRRGGVCYSSSSLEAILMTGNDIPASVRNRL